MLQHGVSKAKLVIQDLPGWNRRKVDTYSMHSLKQLLVQIDATISTLSLLPRTRTLWEGKIKSWCWSFLCLPGPASLEDVYDSSPQTQRPPHHHTWWIPATEWEGALWQYWQQYSPSKLSLEFERHDRPQLSASWLQLASATHCMEEVLFVYTHSLSHSYKYIHVLFVYIARLTYF